MNKIYFIIVLLFTFYGQESAVKLIVLGTVQDAGSPHIGCSKKCCFDLFDTDNQNRKVVSLGLYDAHSKQKWIFEATPDLPEQIKYLKIISPFKSKETPDGIFLTHAHIGHYTGLMYLGREALGAKNVTVFSMPKMKSYLESNGPWSQLVTLGNVNLSQINHNITKELSPSVKVTPFKVPHRDEYSETVGYKIFGPKKSALFIPDINKWSVWKTSIEDEIAKVDFAFLDATFYDGEEINNRPISEIPHPFVIESMERFKDMPHSERSKVYFIHFNHTNPLLNINSKQYQEVISRGFNVAKFHQEFNL